MLRQKTVIFILLFFIYPAQSFAVNFYDGARAPKGLYFLTYTSFYYADETTNTKAKTSKTDYEYAKFEELLRLAYYTPDLVLTAYLPAGYVHSGYYDVSSGGIGDMNLGAGYFLPFKKTDILPMLFIKFPTGEYDSGKSVNYGTNQYDIKPCLFLYKAIGRFSIDAAAKYYFRTENPGTKTLPGDELYLQCLFGWKISKICKAGPSFNWMKSDNQKIDGAQTWRSKKESFSAGADLYLRLPIFSLTITYLRDIRTKNTTKGDFVQIKTVRKF